MKNQGFFKDVISSISDKFYDLIEDASSFRFFRHSKKESLELKKPILMVRPVSDVASQISYNWGGKVIGMMDSLNIPYIDLGPDGVYTDLFKEKVKESSAIFYFDHGGYDKLGDSDKETLVNVGSVGAFGKLPCLTMACMSSKKLGPAAVESGCPIYAGYKEPFIFMEPPYDHLFSKPAVSNFNAMLLGETAEEAMSVQKSEFQKRIALSLAIPYIGWLAAAFLMWDSLVAKLDGSGEFRLI
jgi:hypothetical protein